MDSKTQASCQPRIELPDHILIEEWIEGLDLISDKQRASYKDIKPVLDYLQRSLEVKGQVLIMSACVKHLMNPLHIYCRLRDIGVPKDRARYFCRAYEFSIFKPFLMKHPKKKS